MNLIKDHGTKLIGGAIAVVGTVTALDPAILQVLFGERGAGIVMAVGGLLTAIRGFQNSKASSVTSELEKQSNQ